MAYSYIIVQFLTLPNIDDIISIYESSSGYGLDETFKTERLLPLQTKIPTTYSDDDKYGLVSQEGVSYNNIDIKYTPIGGALTTKPLNTVPLINLGNGTFRFEICSETPVTIHYHDTGELVVWPLGYFTVIGACDSSFNGYVSANYKAALELDYNDTSLFTIVNTNGPVNSGLGTVKITANFHGAVFSAGDVEFATITIKNETVSPDNSVSPNGFEFRVNKKQTSVSPKTMTITTDADNWNITQLPAWLSVSALSGTGSVTISITPVSFSSLAVGEYNATFKVNLNGIDFDIETKLIITDFIINPFYPGKLYFTKEDISLSFESLSSNTYVNLLINISIFSMGTNEEANYTREYNYPLFKKKGKFYVGEIVEGLLEELLSLKDYIPDFKSNYIRKQQKPAEVTIYYTEKNYSDDSVITTGSIEMFKMIKGHRPFMTSNQLCLLTVSQQEITRISPNSVISTSFVYIGKPRVIVKNNNVIIEDFEIEESPDEIIYSYYRFNNNFKPGDLIEIIISKDLETRTQRFLVFKNGLESNFLFFENSNGLIEPYEFTGRRRVLSTLKHTTSSKIINRVGYDKKVFTSNTQGLILNTGQLLKTDHKIILSIIRSGNVWCAFENSDANYIMIDATTTKLTNEDTSNSEEDFDIEFNILEDADASIYPQ
ncbi:hypothetical protein AB9T89_10510 [Flavobacterium oncorhynchi]|uniref:hypothetical protein n=1 Tax=Flavobacterium oncorhynchi TaxID=728056 RepID=UPI00351A0E86